MSGNWWVVMEYGDGGFQAFGHSSSPNEGYESRENAKRLMHLLTRDKVGQPGSVIYLAPQAVKAFNALGYGGNRK